jgi:hypothetical protein
VAGPERIARRPVFLCWALGVTTMEPTKIHDGLNRMVKMALDTGEAHSLEEARDLFARYRLHVALGPDVAHSAALQAAALTAVNAGRRCFLGGVTVSGPLEASLRIPWRRCHALGEAVEELQGRFVHEAPPDVPVLLLGDAHPQSGGSLALRATFDGWTAAVGPDEIGQRLGDHSDFTPVGVLAGALGVSEVFQHLRGSNAAAGRRETGLSLWKPDENYRVAEAGPVLEQLPARLWLIGLGHLGQAILWTLGFLPYEDPRRVELVLQDYDDLVEANDSTSLLTTRRQIGRKKTRTMAAWCEERGFRTAVTERKFDANFKVAPDEPGVAVCGVDNANARAVLEDVGFERIVEAGLGAGPTEYLAFQTHSFPARRSARARWQGVSRHVSAAALLAQPAYGALRSQGLDECGLVQLAERTVGAPFVGAVASALVVAELVRMAQGFHGYEVIDGTLRALENAIAIAAEPRAPYNPGTTTARLPAAATALA